MCPVIQRRFGVCSYGLGMEKHRTGAAFCCPRMNGPLLVPQFSFN